MLTVGHSRQPAAGLRYSIAARTRGAARRAVTGRTSETPGMLSRPLKPAGVRQLGRHAVAVALVMQLPEGPHLRVRSPLLNG